MRSVKNIEVRTHGEGFLEKNYVRVNTDAKLAQNYCCLKRHFGDY